MTLERTETRTLLGYVLHLTDGNTVTTDTDGYVTSRTDGPKGWDYGKGWRITGAATRHNSRRTVSLAEMSAGVPFGQGWVHDVDHGTHRMWGNRRVVSVSTLFGCNL